MIRVSHWLPACCLSLTLLTLGCEANVPVVQTMDPGGSSRAESKGFVVQQHGDMDENDDEGLEFPRVRVRRRESDWLDWMLGGPEHTVERRGRVARSVEIICTNAYQRCLRRVTGGTQTATSCSREYQRCLGRGLRGPDEPSSY